MKNAELDPDRLEVLVEEHTELQRLNEQLQQEIAERNQIEEELKRSEYNLRRAQAISHVGNFTLNVLALENDQWSEEMFRIVGLSPAQDAVPPGEYIQRIVHPEDRERLAQHLARSIEEAIPLDVEYRVVHPDRSIRHVHSRAEPISDASGQVVHLVGTLHDITERKQAEEEIRTNYEKTQAILDTTVDAIITIGERGRVESFNRAAEQIFGYKAEEIIGRNVKMLMPSPYHEEHDDYLRNYLETGHRKIIGIGREVIGQRKDGSIFPMDLAVSEVKLDRRRVFTGVVRDISQRRHLEQEVLGISERERMHIGQELHDGLGSQLTGIGLITKSLARKLETNGLTEAADEVAEIAELIKEADYQARNIARGLVPVAPELDGLRRALQRLTTNAQHLFGISCTLEEEDEVLLEDNATATHLYRIAQEAVNNAVKHGRASRVTIRLVKASDHGGIGLYVQDNGIGLPEVLPENRGIGLRTMQYRAHVVGASLSFEHAAEGGSIVSCRLHPMGSMA